MHLTGTVIPLMYIRDVSEFECIMQCGMSSQCERKIWRYSRSPIHFFLQKGFLRHPVEPRSVQVYCKCTRSLLAFLPLLSIVFSSVWVGIIDSCIFTTHFVHGQAYSGSAAYPGNTSYITHLSISGHHHTRIHN